MLSLWDSYSATILLVNCVYFKTDKRLILEMVNTNGLEIDFRIEKERKKEEKRSCTGLCGIAHLGACGCADFAHVCGAGLSYSNRLNGRYASGG